MVVPRPGKDHLSALNILGDGEVHRRVRRSRAVALERLGHLPGLATILGERKLARATIVNGAAGKPVGILVSLKLTVRERHIYMHILDCLLRASGPGRNGRLVRLSSGQVALAREVGAIRYQGACHAVVDLVLCAVRVCLAVQCRRLGHLHVGADGRENDRNGHGQAIPRYLHDGFDFSCG